MSAFRDIKRKARRDLHQRMRVSALYIVKGSDPLPVHVRVHTKFEALGDQKGTNFNSAERIEPQPKIVFMRNEVPMPIRNAVVSVEPGEAYRLDHVEPFDDITVSAIVVRLSAADAADLPVPSNG